MFKRIALARSVAFLGLSGLLVAFSGTPAFAASQYEDEPQALPRAAPAASRNEDGPQAVPMARPAEAAANLVDRNRNGLSDGLEARLDALRAGDLVDVVVTFSGAGNANSAAQTVGAFDVIQEFTIIDGFAASMTAGQARALAGTPGVFRVEEVFDLSANLETARRDFGVDAVQAGWKDPFDPSVTPLVNDGNGIGICIIDSGARATHIAFHDGTNLRIKAFYNALTDGPSEDGSAAFDDYGHGTIVAGIAAGDHLGGGHPGDWDIDLRGVAPGADLYIAKALGSTGTGSNIDVIEAIEWCQTQPIHVMNLSLGTTSSSDGLDSVSQAVNNAVVEGTVVVISAGNSGPNPYTIGSPAAAERAVTVGAVADWRDGRFSNSPKGGIFPPAFTSRGPTADERIKPDIMAPGFAMGSPGNGDDTHYVSASGTSMAAPFVAGAVALMLGADDTLMTHEVREILYNTAQDRGPVDASGNHVKDNDYGYGLIDVQAAVGTALGEFPVPLTAFPTYSIDTGAIVNSGDFSVVIESNNFDDEFSPSPANLPLSVTLLIDGSVECVVSLGRRCFGYEWRPDLDAELIAPDSSQADLSTCMLDSDTDCGTADSGRQETLIEKDAAAGTTFYTLEVYLGTNDRTEGQFRYEVSTGPLVAGTTVSDPVTIAPDSPTSGDTTAPSPDPMTWASEPTAMGSSSIAMTATTASDPSGPVEYYFDCVTGGSCLDSGWQTDTSYTASGLAANTAYTFQVKARDGALNETSWSTQRSATTEAAGDITLTANGRKVRGLQKADLSWSGATSSNVDIYRGSALIDTVANTGSYTDNIDQRGGESYTYQICEENTGPQDPTTCSNEAIVTF
jgi:serine protease AprX